MCFFILEVWGKLCILISFLLNIEMSGFNIYSRWIKHTQTYV